MKQGRIKRVLLNIAAILTAVAIFLAAVIFWLYQANSTFTETFYFLYSYKIDKPVRAVLLADIHQVEFGEDNGDLTRRIEELHPDIILIAGDVVNKDQPDMEYVVGLCGRLVQIAPVFFGLGNHENEVIYGSDLDAGFLEENAALLENDSGDFSALIQNGTLLKELGNIGVVVVQNEAVLADVNENQLEIGGISTNLSSFWPYSGQFVYEFAENEYGHFKILISHRPDPVMEYASDYNIDLVVSGHNHGGIVRIPGVGGLFSADEGFFPDYDAGMIESGDMTAIISRGLGGHDFMSRIFSRELSAANIAQSISESLNGLDLVPRICNRPELVVIDIR